MDQKEAKLAGFITKEKISGEISWVQQKKLAAEMGFFMADIDREVLDRGILPVRYKRNMEAISLEEVNKLSNSRVAVIGCGGLGGYVIEFLARLGVGSITAWDYDNFEETNLNRQLFSEIAAIGQSKVEIAAQRVKAINPAVKFTGCNARFTEYSRGELENIQVVVDALDNIPSRLMLAGVCRELQIPMVHGAIAGWYGQVISQFPGEDSLERWYGNFEQENGIESQQGVLSFLVANVASLQVSEVIKILLGRGEVLRQKILLINLLDMEMDIMDL